MEIETVHLSEKQRKRDLFSVYFVASLDNFGLGIVFVLFAPLILKPEYGLLAADVSIGTRNVLLGVLFAGFPLAQLIGAPIFGDVADRVGRKKAFYWTIIGTTVGYALSGIAVSVSSYSFLLISRLITGFFAGNLSICLAAIADLSHDEKTRARNFGIVSVVWGISWPFSMLVGGYLSDPTISKYFNAAIPFYLTVILSIANIIVVKKYFSETQSVPEYRHFDFTQGLRHILMALEMKSLRVFFINLLFWTIGSGLVTQWYGALSLQRFNITQQLVSWGLVIQGLFWVLGGSLVNPILLRYFSTRKTAMIGIAWVIVFVIICTFTQKFLVFSIFFWLATIGAAFATSNSLNLVSIHAPQDIQGKAMGIAQSMMSLGWFLMPLIGGMLTAVNISLFYPIAALVLLIALCLLCTKQAAQPVV